MRTRFLLLSFLMITIASYSQTTLKSNEIKEYGTADILNKEYKTIQIGNQIWMASDLDVKTDYHANIKLVKYYEMYYGVGIINYLNSGHWKDRLNGWHVPSNEEWQELIDFYKDNKETVHPLKEGGSSGLNIKYYMPRGGSMESREQFRKTEQGAQINEYWTSTASYQAPRGHENLNTNFVFKLSESGMYISKNGYHKNSTGLEYSYRVRLVKSAIDEKPENNDESIKNIAEPTIKVEEKNTALIINGQKFWITKINGQKWLLNDIEYNGQSSFTYDEAKLIADQIDGWEIPAISDWNTLLNYFGGPANKPTYKSFLRKGTFNGKKDCGYWSISQYKDKKESIWVVGTWYKLAQTYAYKKTDKMSLRLIKK